MLVNNETAGKQDGPDAAHRYDDVDDATIEALGTLSEGMEYMERARGHLFSFHQLTGTSDLKFGKAVEQLRAAGHTELADQLDAEIVGRNVIFGRWTFQIVEDYDDNYWSAVREAEREFREKLVDGRRHLYEARMKEQRRTRGAPHHEARP
jgi:hypothetical protein